MKFKEFIEKMDNEELLFYVGANADFEAETDKTVVLFSHELTKTGAPYALINLAKILKNEAYCVFLISQYDGEIKVDAIEEGIHVIIYPQYIKDIKWLKCLSEMIDIFWANTLFCADVVKRLAPLTKQMFWWIHEDEFIFEKFYELYRDIPHIPTLRILAADSSVQKNILRYIGLESAPLIPFVEDYTENVFRKKLLELTEKKWEINGDIKYCSACGACESVCPLSAITMKENDRGFLYPYVNESRCTRCGKCSAVCPVNERRGDEETDRFWAVRMKDKNKLSESQSGGAFTTFAEEILKKGGIVYGVGLNENLVAEYMRVEHIGELQKLKGSKYVQAKTEHIFKAVREDLKCGKWVLFSGTACHVAGLNGFLNGQDTNRLITCDLICHGVVSPMVYRDYLSDLEKSEGKIIDFKFRDKTVGWHNSVESYVTERKEKKFADTYAALFYSNYCLRESCYVCEYANLKRISDITIGDFWGIERTYPDMDDNRGVSLVLLNTEKGKTLFQKVTDRLEYRILRKEQSVQMNTQTPTARPQETDMFWRDYQGGGIRYALRKYIFSEESSAINSDILEQWMNALNDEKGIAKYLAERGIRRTAVCGTKKFNHIAAGELLRNGISVSCIIDIYDDYGEKSDFNIPVWKSADSPFPKEIYNETVLITDEGNASGIMEWLDAAGFSMQTVIPLSFVFTREV